MKNMRILYPMFLLLVFITVILGFTQRQSSQMLPFIFALIGMIAWFSNLIQKPLFGWIERILIWAKFMEKRQGTTRQTYYTLVLAVISFLASASLFVTNLLMAKVQAAIISNVIFWSWVLIVLLILYVYRGNERGK